jgi:DNA-binding MarR family transcriptional regulator
MDFIADGTAKVLLQPSRWRILEYLVESKDQQYVEQIAKALKIHPRMVSHHLDAMEEKGLVQTKYELVNANGSERGVAVRLSRATPRAREVLQQLHERTKIGEVEP